jgi:hypothetical protein
MDPLQEKLNILQKFDIEDVIEHISLNQLKKIEYILLQKYSPKVSESALDIKQTIVDTNEPLK